TYPILEWCSKEIPRSLVNLMEQYRPQYMVQRDPDKYRMINRRIYPEELKMATKKADDLNIIWKPVS
ncbi:MAG: pyruvate formate lyase-activating protein, partial [Candidatus Heimdallarchaeota archaeon]|nr:pyruvate formate lyase-activating protein [Candidatus Heimdallarchaeota archaeon]